MLSSNFKDYLQQVRKYTSDLSIASSKMSPYQKCQVLLSPFRTRKKEPSEDVIKNSLDAKSESGMSNFAFEMNSDAGKDNKQSDKEFQITRPKVPCKVKDIKTPKKVAKKKRVTFNNTPETSHHVTDDKSSPHVHSRLAYNPVDDRCSGTNQAKPATKSDKCQTNPLACRAKTVTFEVERPDSISLTPGYDPLMDLASPLGLPSPTNDPLLYTRMLLSVAKCSKLIYRSR